MTIWSSTRFIFLSPGNRNLGRRSHISWGHFFMSREPGPRARRHLFRVIVPSGRGALTTAANAPTGPASLPYPIESAQAPNVPCPSKRLQQEPRLQRSERNQNDK
jgi:hypothetical protein